MNRFWTGGRLASVSLVAAAGGFSGGCLLYHAVAEPVKVAATTVVVSGEAATAAVKATGKVAVSAFNAAGNVGSGGLDSAARLTQSGMVTFVDVSTGVITRVPWRAGVTLAAAGAQARVALAHRVVEVVRAGIVAYSSRHPDLEATALASGDVVRVRS